MKEKIIKAFESYITEREKDLKQSFSRFTLFSVVCDKILTQEIIKIAEIGCAEIRKIEDDDEEAIMRMKNAIVLTVRFTRYRYAGRWWGRRHYGSGLFEEKLGESLHCGFHDHSRRFNGQYIYQDLVGLYPNEYDRIQKAIRDLLVRERLQDIFPKELIGIINSYSP